MTTPDLTIALLIPANDSARDALLEAAKEAQRERDEQHVRFYIQPDTSIDHVGVYIGHGTLLTPTSTMVGLSLEQSKGPRFPSLGWRVGGRETRADIQITAKSTGLYPDVVDVRFRLYIHPYSGLLILQAGPDETKIQYLTANRELKALNSGERLVILETLTQVQFTDSRAFNIHLAFKPSIVPELNLFIERVYKHVGNAYQWTEGFSRRSQYGHYAVGYSIGAGTYADIRYAVDTRTGASVALKDVRLVHSGWRREFLNEIEAMDKVKDVPYIMRLIDTWCGDHQGHPQRCPTSALVHYYMTMGLGMYSFADSDFSRLPYLTALRLFRQILLAVRGIHELGVMHRDITLRNMLVVQVSPPQAALSDFGKAATSLHGSETALGPKAYCAPEVWTKNYTQTIDLWSWAYSVAIFLGWSLPSRLRNERITEETLEQLGSRLKAIQLERPEAALLADLVLGILIWDPRRRWTVEQALGHTVWEECTSENTEQYVVEETEREVSASKRPRLVGSANPDANALLEDEAQASVEGDERTAPTIPFSKGFRTGQASTDQPP